MEDNLPTGSNISFVSSNAMSENGRFCDALTETQGATVLRFCGLMTLLTVDARKTSLETGGNPTPSRRPADPNKTEPRQRS